MIEAKSLQWLGKCRIRSKEFKDAIDCLNMAKQLWVQFNQVVEETECDCDLGDAYIASKAYDQARKHLERAAKRAIQIGSRQIEGRIEYCVGRMHLELNDYERAISCLDSAYRIAQEMREDILLNESAVALSVAYRKNGERDKANGLMAAALQMADRAANRGQQCQILIMAGNDLQFDDYRAALSYYQKAIDIAMHLPDFADYHSIARDNLRQLRRRHSPFYRHYERWIERPLQKWFGEASPHGTVDSMRVLPSRQEFDASMVIIDMIGSTALIHAAGETAYIAATESIMNAVRHHSSAKYIHLIKSQGDGVFMVFKNLDHAIDHATKLARELTVRDANGKRIRLRRRLHWGRIRFDGSGEPLGIEVHRLFRMEKLTEDARVNEQGNSPAVPEEHLVLSSDAVAKLPPHIRKNYCQRIGRFFLKGFEEPLEVWAMSIA